MFFLRILAALLLTSTTAFAQHAGGPPRDGPPDIAKMLNLDATRAAKVDEILKVQRDKMRALHEDTDKQLSTVLTPEEMAKLRQARPPRPGLPPNS